MLKVLSASAKIDAEPKRIFLEVLRRPVWRAVRLPVNDDVPARCWIVPGRDIPVNGRPVDVLGRDDAVFCPALIAVAVRSEVPGLGAVARISVSSGSSGIINDRKKICRDKFAKKDNKIIIKDFQEHERNERKIIKEIWCLRNVCIERKVIIIYLAKQHAKRQSRLP